MDGDISFPKPTLDSSTTPELLATMLGTSYGKIKYFYYGRSGSRTASFYTKFEINKKNGGIREIYAPNKQLKVLQGRIASLLSNLYKPKDYVTAFVKGTSLYDNAINHTRKSFVFNIDLKDFFPTITFARVRGLLISKPYSLAPSTASVIAHLTTVNGHLPQGAPSSPVISNMICASLDRQLNSLARVHRAQYTRYADDITFSFYCPLKHLPLEIVNTQVNPEKINHYKAQIGAKLKEIISTNGFIVNPEKVRLQFKHERQVVTGLTVNKKVNVDRRYVRKTSAMIHSIESLGIEGAKSLNIAINPSKENPDEPAFELEPHIQGRLLFIKQIKGEPSPVYRNMAIRFNSLSEEYKVPLSSSETKENISVNTSVVDKCWVLEIDETISQGSGFIVEGGFMVTCAHVVASKDDAAKPVESCTAFRVGNKSDQYKAVVVHYDQHRDIALLKIDSSTHKFPFFRIEEKIPLKQNDKISIYGFPDYKPASTSVGCVWARVVNYFIASAVTYYEVDKVLYSGNSGGPVLNSNHHVVGIAAKGAVDGHKLNAFLCKSELEKVITTYNTLHGDS